MRVYLSKMFCSVAGRLLCSSWLLMLRLPFFAALVFEAGFAHARSQLRPFVYLHIHTHYVSGCEFRQGFF